jgi:hypothetical protein
MGRLDDRVILVTGSTGIAAQPPSAHGKRLGLHGLPQSTDHARTLAERVDGG